MRPFPLITAVALAGYLAWRWRRRELERVTLVAGLIAIAGLAVYGSGAIHPPSLDKLLEDVGGALGKWTYLLVGALAFLETGAFVGLVAPGETAILLGGLVAGQGKIDIVTLIAIVWACAVAGDMTSFYLGRRLGRSFMERHGERVKITPARLAQVEGFFDRHGGKAILLGRFVGLVRAIAPFLAGSSGMPLRRFAPYDIIGAGLWGSTFAILGFVFWHSFDQLVAAAKKGALALGAVIVLVVGIVAAVRWLRDRANRRRLADWVQGQPALRPVVRLVAPLARRGERPARFVWDRVTPGDLGLELTTLVAVALVGAFTFGAYAKILTGIPSTVGDQRAFDIADSLSNAALVDVAKVVTALGALPSACAVVILGAGVLLARRRAAEVCVLVAGMGITIAAVHIAKAAEDRPRPPGALVSSIGSSYPSGHTAYAVAWVAVAIALGRGLPGLGARAAAVTAAVLVVVVVGATRVYLRAHYLSDVLGGAGLGAAIFALCGIGALVIGSVRHNEGAPR